MLFDYTVYFILYTCLFINCISYCFIILLFICRLTFYCIILPFNFSSVLRITLFVTLFIFIQSQVSVLEQRWNIFVQWSGNLLYSVFAANTDNVWQVSEPPVPAECIAQTHLYQVAYAIYLSLTPGAPISMWFKYGIKCQLTEPHRHFLCSHK